MEKIALLFSGQGAQFVGMGHELYHENSDAKKVFDDANQILQEGLTDVCFYGPETSLTETVWCQPCIFAHSMAAFSALRKLKPNLNIQACAGLSLGEFTALTAAGWMSFEDGLRIVRRRGSLMQEACDQSRGTMASIMGMDAILLQPICDEAGVDIANLNCPGQVVISGEEHSITRAISLAKNAGAKRAIPLTVAGAYHSRLMKPAADQLAPDLAKLTFHETHVPVISNVTALPHVPSQVAQRLIEQVTHPVRWEDSIYYLLAQGFRSFIELGPGEVLSGLMKRIDREARVISIGKPSDFEKLNIFH